MDFYFYNDLILKDVRINYSIYNNEERFYV